MAAEDTFNALQDAITASLVDTTRTVGQLAKEDIAFHRSSNPSFGRLLDEQSARLLGLVRNLITDAAPGSNALAPTLTNVEAVDDKWRGIVDVVDNLLEKADVCLDEYTGVVKKLTPAQIALQDSASNQRKQAKAEKSLRYRDLPKPQLLFNRATVNETTPFKPLLRTKPHAIVPLAQSLGPTRTIDGELQFNHPYDTEITNSRYSPSTYLKAEPIPFKPFDSTNAIFVDTPETLQAMLIELRKAREIAVDLEHHDIHSYVGLVSLMQISTRDQDWVVDTLKPWREDLQTLNEVFADPNILKVFHGAFMDMVWLQRDLGLYVVGLFDTFHASSALGYPKRSLMALLSKFANFDAQKQYQMADWRVRPLPKELFDYARSDTHFLLYVYDNLRNELIEKSNPDEPDGNLLDVVLEESKKEALQRYESPVYDEAFGIGSNGWYNLVYRTPALLSNEQFSVFRAIHHWRDVVARREDESTNYIIPKSLLFNLAREMPVDLPSLTSHFHPAQTTPSRLQELLGVIQIAKAAGQNGPDLKNFLKTHPLYIDKKTDTATLKEPMPNPGQVGTLQEQSLLIGQSQGSFRASTSNFWGATISNIRPQQIGSPSANMHDVHLAVPLPPLTAEVFRVPVSNDFNPARVSQATHRTKIEHEYKKDRKPIDKNDVFVVKDLGGRKRKASELADPNTISPVLSRPSGSSSIDNGEQHNDDESGPGEEHGSSEIARKRKKTASIQSGQTKKERRSEEKQKKQKAKEEKKKVAEEQEPFDYANAPSMLNMKHDNKKDRSKLKNKPFDPYSKSLDAPKGMRNSNKEIVGRSFTFKK